MNRVVSVTEFKAKCLTLLDEIDQKQGTITVTKRGRPLATVGPARGRCRKSPEGAWAGKLHITNDRLMADTADLWEVVHRKPKG